MKKFFFVIFLILLFLAVISKNSAYAGPDCDALTGTCKLCDTTVEDDRGILDCPMLGTQTRCCVPKSAAPATSPAPTGIPKISGIDCGDAEASDPEVRKCCLSKNLLLRDFRLPEFGCLLDIAGAKGFCISNVANGFIDYIWSIDAIQSLNEMLTQTTEKINPCVNGNPNTTNYSDPSCLCVVQPATTKMLCDKYLKTSKDYDSCVQCSDKGVWTGVGCVYSDFGRFITEKIFGWGIGLAGLIALLCIIYSAIIMQTSSGNPERIKKAQETLTSCIMGLMIIIFSVFILKLIGIDILKIPSFK
ncbi:hypothetical protein HY612_00370 [Candidatus Roizmanbacteria bacterium]|nr:hypothetical protein [Candidatus Roizmanbacteria bacterium]